MTKRNNNVRPVPLDPDDYHPEDYMLAPFDDDAELKVVTPHNDDAEEACVGAVFINPETYYELSLFLTAKDFYNHKRQWIWEAFENLVKAKTPIDLLTVSDALEHLPAPSKMYKNLLDEIGGPAYLTSLVNQVPSSINAEAYGRIVEGDSVRRKIIAKSNEAVTRAYDTNMAVEAVVADVDAIWRDRPAPSKTSVVSGKEAAERLRATINGGVPMAVEAGLTNCKLAFGGYPKKALTMLIADSSVGKSAYMLQECEVTGFKSRKTLYITLEEPVERMVARRVFTQAAVSRITWRSNQLSPADVKTLNEKIDQYVLANSNINFDQEARTLRQIERGVRQCSPELVVVDDLRHVRLGDHSGDKFSDTGLLIETGSRLKEIAIDNNCAVVVIHHMTVDEASKLWPGQTQSKPTQNYPPDLDSITWAKDLRYTVDLWLALKPDFDADITTDVVKLIHWVVKDKEGPRLQSVEVYYDKRMQWFYDNKSLPNHLRSNYRYPVLTSQMPSNSAVQP